MQIRDDSRSKTPYCVSLISAAPSQPALRRLQWKPSISAAWLCTTPSRVKTNESSFTFSLHHFQWSPARALYSPLYLFQVLSRCLLSPQTYLVFGCSLQLPTFDEVKAVVGFDDYYREEERYASLPPSKPRSNPASSTSTPVVESGSQPTEKSRDGLRKGGSGPNVQAPKQRPSWSGPPPPSVDEIAKRRAEWGLGASTSTPSSPNPKSSSQTTPFGDKLTESPLTESSKEGAGESSSSGASPGLDSVRRLDGTRSGEPTAAEAALKAAEEAAAEALREAERVVAAAKRSAGTASDEPSKPERENTFPQEHFISDLQRSREYTIRSSLFLQSKT
jgi:hypothetical protein